MRRLVLDDPDVKATGGRERYTQLEGYASTFGNVDRGGDVVSKGAFRKTIREAVKRGGVPLLDGHDHRSARNIIGTITSATEDERGLWIRAKLSSEPRAQQIARLVNEGHARKMSIGYQVVKSHQGTVDDRLVTHLDEVKLLEVSVVGLPMNDEAEIVQVKNAGGVQRRESSVEDDLRSIASITNRDARYAAFDALAKNIPAAPADGPDSTGTEAADGPNTTADEGTSDTKSAGHSYALEFLGLSKSEPADGSLGGEPETGPAADALTKGDALLAATVVQEAEQTHRELLEMRGK